MDKKKVGIIGAGVSGLAACKHIIDKGFNPIVFEAEPDIGGVWTHTLESTRLQASTDAYRFSDFPWPVDLTDDMYPRHDKVLEYVKAYANQFDLVKCIRFNSRVVGIEYVGVDEEEMAAWDTWAGNGEAFGDDAKGEWHITVEDTKQGLGIGITEVFQLDFVILCIGLYSGTPNIPDFPTKEGPEIFKGQVIHSMDYSNMADDTAFQFIKGKRVVVIGSGKSAFDIAAECARANGKRWRVLIFATSKNFSWDLYVTFLASKIAGTEHPCTMVCRTKHWLINDSNIFGIDLSYFFLNRFAELLIHKPGQGFLASLLPTFLSPLRWAISKIVETYFKNNIPLEKHGMVPEYSFGHAMSSCQIARLPEGFYNRVEEGSIVLKKSESFTFRQEGVVLNGGDESIQSDLVIFATGFRGEQKLRNIFVSPWLQKLLAGSSNTTAPLYRECIHPRIPQLAIIGYSSSLTDMYVSERMSNWVAHFLASGFKLPRIRKMKAEIQQWEEYKRRYNGKDFRSSCVSAVNIWYNDMLCQDMGQNPRRKQSLIAEWFEPYGPADYANM